MLTYVHGNTGINVDVQIYEHAALVASEHFGTSMCCLAALVGASLSSGAVSADGEAVSDNEAQL